MIKRKGVRKRKEGEGEIVWEVVIKGKGIRKRKRDLRLGVVMKMRNS